MRRASVADLFSIFLLGTAVATALIIFNVKNGSPTGYLIPDVVGLSSQLDIVVDGTPLDEYIPLGLIALYAPLWYIHPVLSVAVNLTLVYLSILLLWDIAVKRLQLPAASTVGILLNPYIYLAVLGPNKDIPVMALSLLFSWLLIAQPRHYRVGALLTVAGAFLLRDGYGAILLLFLFIHSLPWATPRRTVLVGACVTLTLTIAFPLLGDVLPFVQRNIEGSTSIETGTSGLIGGLLANLAVNGPTSAALAYILRLLYTALSLALFPIFLTADGGPYVLGIAYWIFGLIMLMALAACAYTLLRRKSETAEYPGLGVLASFTLMNLIGISAGYFVQPRYLMACFPIGVVVLASMGASACRRIVVSVLVGAFAFIWLYTFIGVPSPSAELEAFSAPSYLSDFIL